MKEIIDLKLAFRFIARILQCPKCGQLYQKNNLRLLDTQKLDGGGSGFLLHSNCRQCNRSVMIDLFLEGEHMISSCILTDLTSHDAASVFDKEPISQDDIITIHQSLDSFNGVSNK